MAVIIEKQRTPQRSVRLDRDPEADLDDLRARIAATRCLRGDRRRSVAGPAPGDDAGARALGRPSTTGASARRSLKWLAHFVAELDGLDIQFSHVRSDTRMRCRS